MFAIIDTRSKFKIVAFARRRRALKYFEAVWYAGDEAFKFKEAKEELRTAPILVPA